MQTTVPSDFQQKGFSMNTKANQAVNLIVDKLAYPRATLYCRVGIETVNEGLNMEKKELLERLMYCYCTHNGL